MTKSYAILMRSDNDSTGFKYLEQHPTEKKVQRRLEHLVETGHLLKSLMVVKLVDDAPIDFYPQVSFKARISLESPEMLSADDVKQVLSLLNV